MTGPNPALPFTSHRPRPCIPRVCRPRTPALYRPGQHLLSAALCLIAALACFQTAPAQLSLTSAVDLALRANPKVLMAQADVDKARSQLTEARDVYIPNLVAGSGLGYSYGFPLGTPTIFNITSQSLLFNYSQKDYIRAARAGLEAANYSLRDARQLLEEDVAITYLALDRAQQRKAALTSQAGFVEHLVAIVQQRLDAGQDTALELLRARRAAAQIRLQQVQLDDEVDTYANHLSRLCGLPTIQINTLPASIPALTASPSSSATAAVIPDGPSLSAAIANAAAKRLLAFGDARYILRPQIAFGAQYSRFSNINNYDLYYPGFRNNLNAAAIGIQIQLPIIDRARRAKAQTSAAEAAHAEQEVKNVRDQLFEGRLKLNHAASELAAKADLAAIDRDLAQNQLDAILVQLQADSSTLMTPKDEQNARIQERQRFLELLDAGFQLRQTQINLLRQNGQLEDWLKSAAASPAPK